MNDYNKLVNHIFKILEDDKIKAWNEYNLATLPAWLIYGQSLKSSWDTACDNLKKATKEYLDELQLK